MPKGKEGLIVNNEDLARLPIVQVKEKAVENVEVGGVKGVTLFDNSGNEKRVLSAAQQEDLARDEMKREGIPVRQKPKDDCVIC